MKKSNMVIINHNMAQVANNRAIIFLNSFIYGVNNFQSIGESPSLVSNSFVLEKCLQPKNPLSAEKGDGRAAFNTKCFVSSISTCLSCANLPHNKNTIPFFSSDIFLITAFVKSIQPIFAWLAGSLALTVSTAFNNNTPCSAHLVRLPYCAGIAIP